MLQKKSSRPELQGKRAQSNLSGTTVRSKESSNTPTVGTPYAETSPSFPLPQHVVTRPKTSGSASTIAGISIPTHHTGSQASSRPETAKSEKRKTKFLNPMAMFSRRKSAQNEAEVQKEMAAQEIALLRQKDVAAAGVKKVPSDFDPRIKGKVVHDFSAPNRQSMRSFTFNDAADGLLGHQSRLQSANSAPAVPALQQDAVGVRQSTFSGNSSTSAGTRKSMHAPVFIEHLSDTPMGANRMNAERAESLANRDFLQRASHASNVSQESAVLPPFARRSQVVDPMPTAYHLDDRTQRLSDPSSSSAGTEQNRASTVSSFSSVSPITARNSVFPPEAARQSMSPISPTSPSRAGFGAGARPKSMASSHLRESTVFFDEGEEYPQQRPTLQRNPASDHSVERIPSPPNRNAPPPPAVSQGALSPPNPTSRSVSPAISNVSTPTEEYVANTVRMSKPPATSARVVEKLASAVGHTKRSTSTPKHHASNASRFSFQLGGSAAEELALEEKARKMRSGVSGFSSVKGGKAGSPSEEDEDEYFDENAMDDMDEMELNESPDEPQTLPGASQQQLQPAPLNPASALPPQIAVQPRQQFALPPSQATAGIMNVNDARLQLMISESDGEDMSGEDEESASEGGYYDFVDYGSVSHSRGGSVTTEQSRKASVAEGNVSGIGHGVVKTSSPLASPLSPLFPLRSDTPTAPATAQHQRILSDDSALTLNTNVQPSAQGNAAFTQDNFSPNESTPGGVGGARPRSEFYMQPAAAGYSPTTTEKPPLNLSHESESVEKRSTSGSTKADTAPSPAQVFAEGHKSTVSSSTMSSSTDSNKRPFSTATLGAGSSSRSSGPRTGSTGLGVSGFSDFHFSDSPENSRPVSKAFQPANENRLTGDSETIPQHAGWMNQHRKRGSSPLIPSSERNSKGSGASPVKTVGGEHRYTGSVGRNLQARKSSLAEFFNADAGEDGDDEDDDMYFDGGGFEGDLQAGKQELGARVDEEVFDDERFERGKPMGVVNGFATGAAPTANGPNGLSLPANVGGGLPTQHQRDHSGMTDRSMLSSTGVDGPYPSFAMPNALKARQRDSQMLLEDLVLQEPAPPTAGFDPKFIPQRNPSEDAKRLGLSSRVPPLPSESTATADRLQMYHAALAEAANRAASEGRFSRMASVSKVGTQRSVSGNSGSKMALGADSIPGSLKRQEDNAVPSDALPSVNGGSGSYRHLDRSGTQQTTSTGDSTQYLNAGAPSDEDPPRMSFDFGFDTLAPLDLNFRTSTSTFDNRASTSFHDPTASSDFDDTADFEDDDDDIISAANASALASDDAGFYGSEFGFFAKARPGSSSDTESVNGGFFGEDGDDGILKREKSGREPNLTPITERSEFSTRNSFIGAGSMGMFGPASVGAFGPPSAGVGGVASPALARLPVSPLMEGSGDITSFDQLKKLRMNAFSGGNASLGSSNGGHRSATAGAGLAVGTGVAGSPQGYFPAPPASAGVPGVGMGGSPMQWTYSSTSEGSSSSAPGSAHPSRFSNGGGFQFHDSPVAIGSGPASAGAGAERRGSFSSPLTEELLASNHANNATPRKTTLSSADGGRPESPMTARKTANKGAGMGHGQSHSRTSSGADSVTYVRENDPSSPNGQPRWVLERRRTSELGLSELVGREVVQGGWI